MSFDLFLQHFKAGVSADADRSAVKQVINWARTVTPDQYGQYDIPLPSGSAIRLSASDIDSDDAFDGCAFHLHDFSIEYCDFILKLAVAGDFVIFNAQGKDDPESPVLIFSNEEQEAQMPQGMYTHPVVARDGLHLYALLDGTYEGWERYRAQVLQTPFREGDA